MDNTENRLSCIYLAEATDAAHGCMRVRTPIFTGLALIAFAANSLLCRMTLGEAAIDAAGFTFLRLIAGALVLWLLTVTMTISERSEYRGSWVSAGMLFAYAALPIGNALLMALAGISWGIYSLRGREATHPGMVTRDNFLRTVPLALLTGLIFLPTLQITFKGGLLAVISGGITSAIGYIIWYAALQGLQATHVALVQLLVPLLAAAAGVFILSEQLTVRLIVSAILILGGIALAISYPVHAQRPKPPR